MSLGPAPEGFAWVRIKDPSYQANGQLYINPAVMAWGRVEVLHPSDCEHVETMCLDCMNEWARDYDVRDTPPPESRPYH